MSEAINNGRPIPDVLRSPWKTQRHAACIGMNELWRRFGDILDKSPEEQLKYPPVVRAIAVIVDRLIDFDTVITDEMRQELIREELPPENVDQALTVVSIFCPLGY